MAKMIKEWKTREKMGVGAKAKGLQGVKRSNRELEASIKDEKGVGREVGTWKGKYATSRRV